MKQLLTLFCSLLFLYSPAQNKSKYGVELVDEYSFYQKQLKADPTMKMVDLKTIKGLHFDIRYATENNFTKEVVYPQAEAFVRKPLIAPLKAIVKELNEYGLTLKIYDAYRPYDATVKFYEIYKDTTYVASPYGGSRHNRGCAIDLTLVKKSTGEEIEMPTAYDDFTNKAHPDYQGVALSVQAVEHRDLLIEIMERNGFKVYPSEWWHFDFVGWEKYPILNLSFEELKNK